MLDEESNIKLIDFGLVSEPEVSDVTHLQNIVVDCVYALVYRTRMICSRHAVVLQPMRRQVCISVWLVMEALVSSALLASQS